MNPARDELGPADAEAGPPAENPAWRVIHSGVAESADTPAARALMRTSDGEFRITASHVDGRVGLTIEMLKPEPAEAADAADLPGAAEALLNTLDGDEDEDEDEDDEESLSPTMIRSVLSSPTAVPRPRRGDREGRDDLGGRDGRTSEAA